MAIAVTLEEYLQSLSLAHDLIAHVHASSTMRSAEAAHISGELVAKGVLLGDGHSYLLCVVPATHQLELDRVNQALSRDLVMIGEDEIEEVFPDCERGAIPVAGEAYGIETVIDKALLACDNVYFEAGDHEHLVHMQGDAFSVLMKNAQPIAWSHHR